MTIIDDWVGEGGATLFVAQLGLNAEVYVKFDSVVCDHLFN